MTWYSGRAEWPLSSGCLYVARQHLHTKKCHITALRRKSSPSRLKPLQTVRPRPVVPPGLGTGSGDRAGGAGTGLLAHGTRPLHRGLGQHPARTPARICEAACCILWVAVRYTSREAARLFLPPSGPFFPRRLAPELPDPRWDQTPRWLLCLAFSVACPACGSRARVVCALPVACWDGHSGVLCPLDSGCPGGDEIVCPGEEGVGEFGPGQAPHGPHSRQPQHLPSAGGCDHTQDSSGLPVAAALLKHVHRPGGRAWGRPRTASSLCAIPDLALLRGSAQTRQHGGALS